MDVDEASLPSMRAWAKTLDLNDADALFCSDLTFRRYVRACKGDTAAAQVKLRATLAWRAARGAARAPGVDRGCPLCDEDRRSHCFLPVGLGAPDTAVVYGCPPRACTTDVTPTIVHCVDTLEHIFEQEGVERWTWVVDFNGFGLTHALQARLGISFATVFADHFPERLAHLVLVNPPTVWNILLTAIRPFADARTMSKVISISGPPASITSQLEALGLVQPAEDKAECVLRWLEAVLAMTPTPGSLPPMPKAAAGLFPRATRKAVEA
jgi:hypothetical protein